MSMMSVLLKTYYAQQKGLDPRDVFVVAVMPCVAKKFEARRPAHCMPDGTPYTDAVLTTRELIWMIKSYGIDFWTLQSIDLDNFPSEHFDDPLGESSGAGDIFGTTGGVMEATLRTAVEKLTGSPAARLEFTEIRAVEGLREASIEIAGRTINVAVANGLVNAAKILDQVVRGEKEFHLIEIMACPGGCIGGGGQPYPPRGMRPQDPELLRLRAQALYAIDQSKALRCSHANPAIHKLYQDFLGAPASHKAHELLHTHYQPRLPRGIR
jgi:iron only hydrogenase large subunit-like protein